YLVVVNGHIYPNSKGALAVRSTLYGYNSMIFRRSMSWNMGEAINNGYSTGVGIDKPDVGGNTYESGEIEPIAEDSDAD
ncbi:hypothetical protein, partial [Staphylococcus aureus]|uniref:hypothetical protein n=1 Tax=Staphylococcus aureus TaxID=1280 RepID=UPI0013EE4363